MGVEFQKRDITNDPTAMAELLKIGVLTTPVTVMGGGLWNQLGREARDCPGT